MTPLVDASIASALISPDPVSHITTKNDEEKANEKVGKKNQKESSDGKPKSGSALKKQSQEATLVTADERFYAVDSELLEKLRTDKPWAKGESSSSSQGGGAASASSSSGQQQQQQQQGSTSGTSRPRPVAKFFETLSLSPSAVTKMMMHCQSGVEKGISKGGNPIEVMGLMLGRPDPHKPTNLIVTDAFPLPIEGFETRVVADDQNVVNHMISLGERLEKTRKEKFMGWYHSHPFDLVLGEESRSHCFLSQTDLSTQLQWQRAEDPHGNPFAAIVIDPLLAMHTGTPQLKAFRAYPPTYQSAIPNECPDGSIVTSEKLRLEKWGSCWNRYYELKVEYYMSEASRSVLGDLTQNYLWMKSFQRDSNESGVKGVSASEATKVTTLREIATAVRSEVGSSGNGSEGRTPLAHPTSRASAIEPLVRKLREAATITMTQQTSRCVHTNIFKAPNAVAGKDGETKEGEAIATAVTH